METIIENVDATKAVESKEDKREFINIAVTKEQKNAISKEAIVNCGISVSEYCRTKILTPKAEVQEAEIVISPLSDEEKAMYEEGMLKSTERDKKNTEIIKQQAEELINLKSIISGDSDLKEEKPLIPESAIVLELTPEQRKIVDLAIEIESKSFFGDNYANIFSFIKKKIGDLVTSNQGSFPDEYYDKSTPEYKIAFEFIKYLKETL